MNFLILLGNLWTWTLLLVVHLIRPLSYLCWLGHLLMDLLLWILQISSVFSHTLAATLISWSSIVSGGQALVGLLTVSRPIRRVCIIILLRLLLNVLALIIVACLLTTCEVIIALINPLGIVILRSLLYVRPVWRLVAHRIYRLGESLFAGLHLIISIIPIKHSTQILNDVIAPKVPIPLTQSPIVRVRLMIPTFEPWSRIVRWRSCRFPAHWPTIYCVLVLTILPLLPLLLHLNLKKLISVEAPDIYLQQCVAVDQILYQGIHFAFD